MDIKKRIFVKRVVRHWNRLPREMVEPAPLRYLKDVALRDKFVVDLAVLG